MRKKHRTWQFKNSSPHYTPQQNLIIGLTRLATIGLGVLTAIFLFYSLFLPRVSQIENYLGPESTTIMDRNGKVIFNISGDQSRKVVPLSEIPKHLQQATLAIEDHSFYEHDGYDLGGIVKAVLSQVGIGSPRGGSTITQQLVKNTFLTSERTITRKIKEVILSTRLERKFEKDEILEMYLNQIPYGGIAYGVEQASQNYFKKPAKEVTKAEAAVLAAIIQAPSYYSPHGTHVYTRLEKQFTEKEARKIDEFDDLDEDDFTFGLLGQTVELAGGKQLYLPGRVDSVINRMESLDFLTEEEANAVKIESNKLTFAPRGNSRQAAHFVDYIQNQLTEQFGPEVVASGLKVTTSLDLDLQKKAEEIVAANAQRNLSYGANNHALVTIENKTGQILTMVGSADFFNEEIGGQYNVFGESTRLQPGSSFKPFVYAKAIENKVAGAGTVFWDVKTNFGGWTPNNYSGGFSGPLTMRQALGRSLNIPAIKAYFLAGEEEEITKYIKKLGINLIENNYGPSMALGTVRVNPLEFAHAYTAFAQNGKQCDLTPILKVSDRDGNILYEAPEQPKCAQKIDEQAAYIVTNILSDNSNKIGPRLILAGRDAGTKTGTSNDELPGGRIAPGETWTAGFTPQLTTIVWAGNTDSSPLKPSADGYNIAAPTWNTFMTEAHKILELPAERFEQPAGIKRVAVSKFSGLLPVDGAPESLTISDIFPDYGIPKKVDDSIRIVKVDTRNGLLPNEYCPENYVSEGIFLTPQAEQPERTNWQEAIYAWLNANGSKVAETAGLTTENTTETPSTVQDPNYKAPKVFYTTPPAEISNLCSSDLANNKPQLQISNLNDGDRISYGNIPVELNIEANNGLENIEFYFNNILQYQTSSSPYVGEIRVTNAIQSNQTYPLEIKVYDKAGFISTKNIRLKVVLPDQPHKFPVNEEENENEDSNKPEDDQPTPPLIQLGN